MSEAKHTPGPLRLRDHFTLHQWREMLGMQRAAECEARRLKVPYTECTEIHGTRALMPVFGRAAIAKAAGSTQ